MSVWQELSKPFDERLVHFRVGPTGNGKGMALAYVDARDVMERLDRVAGPDNWMDFYHHAGSSIICELRIREPGGEWISKSDGAGETDVEGSKGAISAAFKRAAVKFGIGRYLYWCPDWWQPLAPNGKFFDQRTLDKLALDFGAWQRDFFGEDVPQTERRTPVQNEQRPHRDVQPRQEQRHDEPTRSNSGGINIDTAMKEFMATLASANQQRREDGLQNIKGSDVLAELGKMNYRTSDVKITNWSDLKTFGLDAVTALTRELNDRPCMIGNEDGIPF